MSAKAEESPLLKAREQLVKTKQLEKAQWVLW
jgi:hypothetical protein